MKQQDLFFFFPHKSSHVSSSSTHENSHVHGEFEFFVWSRYTCFAGLFPLLSKGTLPLVTVEEISQIIDSENLTVENIVLLAGPLATTPIGNGAKFEVRSPKSVQVLFLFLLMLSFLINH